MRSRTTAILLVALGCGGGDHLVTHDGAPGSADDAAAATDGAPASAADARGADAASGAVDASPPRPDAAGAPDATPTGTTMHIHVLIDNFCNTATSPTDVSAALNSGLMLTFHNHSVDYEADVWSSRGYGFLMLGTGATWNDPVAHCGGPNPYVETFDVSIAGGGGTTCPGALFSIHCQ